MRTHVRSFGLFLFVSCLLLFVPLVRATIFGNIRGIVHDPQHRPIAGVEVTLKSCDFGLDANRPDRSKRRISFRRRCDWRIFDRHPSSWLS